MQEPGPPSWKSQISETKNGHESHETLTLERLPWRGTVATVKYRQIFSLERVLSITNPRAYKDKYEEEKLVACPRLLPDTRTDWPTDRQS
jgi:hypothetical protein